MPVDVVDSLFEASPYAVAAALTALLPRFGWRLTAVGDFGRSVFWSAFDGKLEFVELQAEITPLPENPGITRLRVSRVDPAIASAERFAAPPLLDGTRRRPHAG